MFEWWETHQHSEMMHYTKPLPWDINQDRVRNQMGILHVIGNVWWKWNKDVSKNGHMKSFLFLFHNVAMILPRLGRIPTAVIKCWENQLKAARFRSTVTTVLGHDKTVPCVGVCGRGCLLQMAKVTREEELGFSQRMLSDLRVAVFQSYHYGSRRKRMMAQDLISLSFEQR